MDPKDLKDRELVEMLFEAGDTLPEEHAREVISRGDRMVRLLDDIVSDRYAWSEDLPAWWAVTHATYLLGAIGGRRVVFPLMRALRHADALYNDWVLDMLPSILGSLGGHAAAELEAAARDKGDLFMARTVALEGLAGWTVREPAAGSKVFPLVMSVFADASEARAVRRGAGVILIDFKRAEAKEQLQSFAREEATILEYDPAYPAAFLPEDVKGWFGTPEQDTSFYATDWMMFYKAEEIAKRQERWRREDKRRGDASPEIEVMLHGSKTVLRDSPCPCGSGKKYKNCCMGKLH
ncbi:MAG: SEC-C domain-containing protein [Deltaproteobacteria bacterium]|nr:SEC-C domain-containing protein [Deltaproteobacteria bacterium]